MKIKDLVKELKKLDQDMPIMRAYDTNGDRDDWGLYYSAIEKLNVKVIEVEEVYDDMSYEKENGNKILVSKF